MLLRTKVKALHLPTQSIASAHAKLCNRSRKALHPSTQSFAFAYAKHCMTQSIAFAYAKHCMCLRKALHDANIVHSDF